MREATQTELQTEAKRQEFVALFNNLEHAMEYEAAVLSAGLDNWELDNPETPEYWDFMIQQVYEQQEAEEHHRLAREEAEYFRATRGERP
jgi:hypothetical protein